MSAKSLLGLAAVLTGGFLLWRHYKAPHVPAFNASKASAILLSSNGGSTQISNGLSLTVLDEGGVPISNTSSDHPDVVAPAAGGYVAIKPGTARISGVGASGKVQYNDVTVMS